MALPAKINEQKPKGVARVDVLADLKGTTKARDGIDWELPTRSISVKIPHKFT